MFKSVVSAAMPSLVGTWPLAVTSQSNSGLAGRFRQRGFGGGLRWVRLDSRQIRLAEVLMENAPDFLDCGRMVQAGMARANDKFGLDALQMGA